MCGILCWPCKKLCTPSRNLSRAFCCFPLALFGILFGLVFIGWGVYEIVTTVLDPNWANASLILVLIVACMKIVIGLLAFFSVVAKWSSGVSCLSKVGVVVILFIVITFIATWIYWIVKLVKEEFKGDRAFIIYAVIFSIFHIIFFILCIVVFSVFASLAKIFEVGGTGWEFKTWREIASNDDDV